MKNKLTKILQYIEGHKLLCGVFSGVIVFFLTNLIFPSVRNLFKYLLFKSIRFCFSSISVKGWILIILAALSLWSLYKFVVRFKKTKINDFKLIINKVLWKGKYLTANLKVTEFDPFCPNCDYELVQDYKETFPFQSQRTIYYCAPCNKLLIDNLIPYVSYMTSIKNEIERLLRKKFN